jgi:GNAT superfamily N-acetyltransferase
MNIRIASVSDVETLFNIRTSVIENHQSREELATIGVTFDSVAEKLESESRAWIAEVNGQPVAFSMADAKEGTIFAMFVLPSYERLGFGRALMQEAQEWLFSKGWSEIWLLTGPNTRAAGFYKHLGWENKGLQDDGQVKFTKLRT